MFALTIINFLPVVPCFLLVLGVRAGVRRVVAAYRRARVARRRARWVREQDRLLDINFRVTGQPF